MAARVYSERIVTLGVLVSVTLAIGYGEPPSTVASGKLVSIRPVSWQSPPNSPSSPPGDSVDYIAKVNQRARQGVTPDNNSAVLFLQAMGPDALDPALRQQYLQLLEISSPPARGPFLIGYKEYAKKSRQAGTPGSGSGDQNADVSLDDIYAAASQSWAAESLPLVAGWLQAVEQPLAVVVESTKRPRRFDPLISISDPPLLLDTMLPMVTAHRHAAHALTTRATLKLGAGSVAEAWQDLLACHRFGRLTGQGQMLIEMLMADAIEDMACTADQAVLAHGNLTADQARQMYNDLQGLPPLPQMADGVDVGERYIFLDCAQVLADRGLSHIGKILDHLDRVDGKPLTSPMKDLSGLDLVPINADVVRQVAAPWFDQLVAVLRQPTWPERSVALDKFEADCDRFVGTGNELRSALVTSTLKSVFIGSHDSASKTTGKLLMHLFFPHSRAAAESEVRTAQIFELTKIGCLLAAYRADHGTYPVQLTELVPQYVTQVPADLFTGRPLIYKPQSIGYMLYSVGANGRDDDGLRYEDRSADGNPNCDDLVVQIPIRPIGRSLAPQENP